MRLVPWAGVAARLSSSVALSHGGDQEIRTRGAAYCFLPLPVITGLPVHVNGYFELSSNRRGICAWKRLPDCDYFCRWGHTVTFHLLGKLHGQVAGKVYLLSSARTGYPCSASLKSLTFE